MAGYRRVLDVGKSPLGEAGAPATGGSVGKGHGREKTIEDQLLDQIQGERPLEGVANEFAP